MLLALAWTWVAFGALLGLANAVKNVETTGGLMFMIVLYCGLLWLSFQANVLVIHSLGL